MAAGIEDHLAREEGLVEHELYCWYQEVSVRETYLSVSF